MPFKNLSVRHTDQSCTLYRLVFFFMSLYTQFLGHLQLKICNCRNTIYCLNMTVILFVNILKSSRKLFHANAYIGWEMLSGTTLTRARFINRVLFAEACIRKSVHSSYDRHGYSVIKSVFLYLSHRRTLTLEEFERSAF